MYAYSENFTENDRDPQQNYRHGTVNDTYCIVPLNIIGIALPCFCSGLGTIDVDVIIFIDSSSYRTENRVELHFNRRNACGDTEN